MKIYITIGLVLIAVAASYSANAIVFGGSNLGIFGYPSHACTRPYSKPYKPYSFGSQYEIDRYNAEVDSYNSVLRIYMGCIQEYVDNSKNDIDRIKEKVTEAISQ